MADLKLMATEALLVQDACNLSGVAHGFSKAMEQLWDVAREEGKGTDWVNTHPISVVWADKIQSLTTSGSHDVMQAYGAVQKLSEGD